MTSELSSYPHGIFAAGRAFMPTQEKEKKKKKELGSYETMKYQENLKVGLRQILVPSLPSRNNS